MSAHRFTLGLLVALVPWSGAAAQDAGTVRKVALRVSSRGQAAMVVVDRGERDQVRRGDMVTFFPRAGGSFRGVVVKASERSAVVGLQDERAVLPPGTRGEVDVPESRFAPRQPSPETKPKTATEPGTEGTGKWRNKDESWKPGMPLLGAQRPLRPAERGATLSGRVFLIGDLTRTHDSFANSFLRAGTSLRVENPFGHGGGIKFDGEFDHRTEQNENEGNDLLVRSLSYFHGGTRFDATRWEIGRFLQHGVPELQVLDGAEWGMRRRNGDRFGASAGFMPQPDDDFESGKDFQLAVYYEWVSGTAEELVVTGALQKTFHSGRADRDLLLGKIRYLPADAWQLNGAVWLDIYDGKDKVKSRDFDVSQAWVTLTRQWGGSGVDVTFRRAVFPEMLRWEFQPLLAQDLADSYFNRLSLGGWQSGKSGRRLHGEVGVWQSQADTGGFGEAGISIPDVVAGARVDFTGFATLGEFTSDAGVRISCTQMRADGGWDLLYEVAYRHYDNYPSTLDDLIQHRLRVARSFRTDTGWDCSVRGEAHLFDEDFAWTLGVYLQRGF